MFGYNPPTLEKYIAVPFGFGLLAYAIVRLFPSPEAIFFFAAIEINVAIIPAIFLIRQFADYEKDQDTPAPNNPPVVKQYLDMNKADERGNVYALVTDNLKVNAVMQFNKTLIEQYQGKLEVNLTESFWLNKQPGADESKWIKAGGVGRADFVDMLERGVLWGAYKKVGGQGKRVHSDWRKISQLAQGYPLPRFDQLPKQ